MSQVTAPEGLMAAARVLFSPEELAVPRFWEQLDEARLKRAFREQVRRWHPDAPRPLPGWPAAARQARFVAVKQAYDLLRDYLGEAPPLSGPRIIAVAGAKGGVGASVIAANLGVLLARAGRRVMLADLDPAGPILPLYLGNLPTHRAPSLDGPQGVRGRCVQWSPFGPAVVTGADLGLPEGDLGGLALRHLLTELRGLGAEDLLCDLGSAPAPGALDLFLAARHQLLVTTCEPAAFVRAYGFLKRLRQRLSPAKSPAGSGLRPLVLFNQVTARDRPREMGRRLQEVAGRCLGLRLTVLTLPHREEMAHSVRELVPAACRGKSPVSRHLAALARVFLP